LQIVNGYVCLSSCDVALAQQGKNPHPGSAPQGADKTNASTPPGQAASANGVSPSSATRPAVTFGGALAQVNGASSASSPAPPPPSSAPYSPGSLFSLTA
jgi:hypothetical protein